MLRHNISVGTVIPPLSYLKDPLTTWQTIFLVWLDRKLPFGKIVLSTAISKVKNELETQLLSQHAREVLKVFREMEIENEQSLTTE